MSNNKTPLVTLNGKPVPASIEARDVRLDSSGADGASGTGRLALRRTTVRWSATRPRSWRRSKQRRLLLRRSTSRRDDSQQSTIDRRNCHG